LLVLLAPVNAHNSDPWGTLLVSQALLQHGSPNIEFYSNVQELTYRLLPLNGRTYYFYPIGTSIAAMPAVWLANRLGLDMSIAAHDHVVQHILSALTVAGACVLFYVLGRQFIGRRAALFLALTFTLGTSVASTMGAALWSFNGTLLLTLATLLLIVRAHTHGPNLPAAALIGILLVCAYVTRPTALALAVALMGYLALMRRWRVMLIIACTSGIVLLGFALLAYQFYGVFIPPYYQGQREEGFGLALANLPATFYGIFFSPGRGLFTFTPFLILPFIALLIWPQLWRNCLTWLALCWFGVQSAAMLSWTHWWGGASFGPRLFTDALPALFLLTLLTWQAATELRPAGQRVVGSIFGLLAAVSIAIHTGQGLYQPATQLWHFVGLHSIDVVPAALFDWRYPQFLSTPERLVERDLIYRDRAPLPNTLWGQPVFGVSYLRNEPDWRPQDVRLSDDLALQFNGTLWSFNEAFAMRLLYDYSELWIVSDKAQPAIVHVEVRPIGRAWPLLLMVNDAEPILLPTDTHQHLTLYLNLQRGANRIRLELLGCQPQALAPNGDTRLIAGLHNLSIVSHPLRAP
jgi:hypothetical protein